MTSAGRRTLLAGVIITIVGAWSGYPALTAMGAALLAAVAIALALVAPPADLATSRRVRPDRVVAGEAATTELTITNRGRRATGAGKVHERIGERTVPIDLPSLEPGESVIVTHDLPTTRRGVYAIGPLIVRRGDPVGLARRGELDTDQAQLIVHPAVHEIPPFPAGLRRDMEGIPSGEAAEGGITFSNLREYVPGDDLRLVHWRSSAKTGELMVRHNIDVHRPRTSVILDVNAAFYDDESFEEAVRVAASIVTAAMMRRFNFTLRTTTGEIIDERSSRLAVMDRFAALVPVEAPRLDLGRAALEASREPAGLSCAAVTGRAGVDALQSLGPLRHRFEQLTMVRMGSVEGAEVHEIGGAILINAGDSIEFAQAWTRRMKR